MNCLRSSLFTKIAPFNSFNHHKSHDSPVLTTMNPMKSPSDLLESPWNHLWWWSSHRGHLATGLDGGSHAGVPTLGQRQQLGSLAERTGSRGGALGKEMYEDSMCWIHLMGIYLMRLYDGSIWLHIYRLYIYIYICIYIFLYTVNVIYSACIYIYIYICNHLHIMHIHWLGISGGGLCFQYIND